MLSAGVARAELVRRWPDFMTAYGPHDDASAAAAATAADLAAEAERRADAARMQTYPLPRRVTDAYLRDLWATCSRSLLTRPAANRKVIFSLDGGPGGAQGLLKELRGLEDSSQSLVDTAHLAGLAWVQHGARLSIGDSPGMAAVRAWCADFVEVSAGVHEAHMLAKAIAVVPAVAAVDRLGTSFRGMRHASLSQ